MAINELPPVTVKIKADTTAFIESMDEAKKALASFRPSDYQIRLDALTLTVQMCSLNEISTPEIFAEWQQCFEASLRQALESAPAAPVKDVPPAPSAPRCLRPIPRCAEAGQHHPLCLCVRVIGHEGSHSSSF